MLSIQQADREISSISTVLKDITVEFLIKQNIPFNTAIFARISSSTKELVDNFLLKLGQNVSIKVDQIGYVDAHLHMKYPMVLFTESMQLLIDFEVRTEAYRFHSMAMPYVIYMPTVTMGRLASASSRLGQLNLAARGYFLYGFFVVNEKKSIKLVTIEWFRDKVCNQVHLKVLNTFHKNSQKWQKKLENYEKFLDFFGCEMVMLLPLPIRGIIQHVSGYASVKNDSFTVHGITPKVFEIGAKVYNFMPAYQPAVVHPSFIHNTVEMDINALQINGTVKEPLMIYFHVVSDFQWYQLLRTSHAFVDFQMSFVVTPVEAYTAYEKLAHPFDLETWIMLAVTFTAVCAIILFIKFCTKTARNLIYGREIQNPFWNVVRIFFGIATTKQPKSNFPRFILTLFVWFCLIFRTCFQSKSFELMTSQLRRPMPKTLADLIDGNYTVIADRTGNTQIRENARDEYGRK